MTKRPIGTEGLGLFEPRARTADPQTSHDAGASMVEEAANQRAQILAFLLEHPQGATADALDEKLGWRSSTAGRRLSELIEAHKVMRCDGLIYGEHRPPALTQKTRQGRWAYIHIHAAHISPDWLVK